MNKLFVRTFEMFFELHVIGSFDAPKNAFLKNYVIFYSETENKILQSSNNHPYWKPAILFNKLCFSVPLLKANLERRPNEFD